VAKQVRQLARPQGATEVVVVVEVYQSRVLILVNLEEQAILVIMAETVLPQAVWLLAVAEAVVLEQQEQMETYHLVEMVDLV
jgi:hypothetical protein